jgi:hypothetical protein
MQGSHYFVLNVWIEISSYGGSRSRMITRQAIKDGREKPSDHDLTASFDAVIN